MQTCTLYSFSIYAYVEFDKKNFCTPVIIDACVQVRRTVKFLSGVACALMIVTPVCLDR